MARKKYTTEDKVAALATLRSHNNNVLRASRDLGIPRKTLIDWRAGEQRDSQTVRELLPAAVEDLSDKLDRIAQILSDHMTDPEKLAKANLQQVATSFAITIDKRNLLRGMPTSISEHRSDKQRYEGAVTQMISEAAKKGVTVEREEALNLLEYHLPDIRKFVH